MTKIIVLHLNTGDSCEIEIVIKDCLSLGIMSGGNIQNRQHPHILKQSPAAELVNITVVWSVYG